jgi:cyclophilin family peptidyl-prolyl cis-trans isomerase
MARSQHPDSAGCQFYITYGPQPHLDGNYTVFGQVVAGMEHVDGIKQGDRMRSVTIVEE